MSDREVELLVVGGGLFGSAIAANYHWHHPGKVLIVDRGEPEAGSKPAACLMKPSWFSGVARPDRERALGMLDRCFGLKSIQFNVGPLKTEVLWCDPAVIMDDRVERIVGQVDSIHGQVVNAWVGADQIKIRARNIVLACGIWVNELLPKDQQVEVTPKGGWAFEAAPHYLAELGGPFIKPWAPYKQIVAFDMPGRDTWIGDGTALKPDSMDQRALIRSRDRCAAAIGCEPVFMNVKKGFRPFCKLDKATPAHLSHPRSGLWVATGGGKNGTLGAGWVAEVFMGLVC